MCSDSCAADGFVHSALQVNSVKTGDLGYFGFLDFLAGVKYWQCWPQIEPCLIRSPGLCATCLTQVCVKPQSEFLAVSMLHKKLTLTVQQIAVNVKK